MRIIIRRWVDIVQTPRPLIRFRLPKRRPPLRLRLERLGHPSHDRDPQVSILLIHPSTQNIPGTNQPVRLGIGLRLVDRPEHPRGNFRPGVVNVETPHDRRIDELHVERRAARHRSDGIPGRNIGDHGAGAGPDGAGAVGDVVECEGACCVGSRCCVGRAGVPGGYGAGLGRG